MHSLQYIHSIVIAYQSFPSTLTINRYEYSKIILNTYSIITVATSTINKIMKYNISFKYYIINVKE